MTSPVSAVIRQASAISSLVDPDRILSASGLPPAIVERLQSPRCRVRSRFTKYLSSKLGLTPLDKIGSAIPESRDSILTCAAWVGLALAIAQHDGIFFKDEYALLIESHGERALSFALQNRDGLAGLDSEALLSMDRDTLLRVGGIWLAAWAEAELPTMETWIIAALPSFHEVNLPDLKRLSRAAPMIRAAVQACWGEGSRT